MPQDASQIRVGDAERLFHQTFYKIPLIIQLKVHCWSRIKRSSDSVTSFSLQERKEIQFHDINT